MTTIEKVLLRKDMASVAVAIVVASAVLQLLSSIVMPLTYELIRSDSFSYAAPGSSFSDTYLVPVVAFALSVIALELLLRIVIFSRQQAYKKGKK